MNNIILGLAIVLIPLTGYHAMVGSVLGMLQALTILVPLNKAPLAIRLLVVEHPLLADVVLSGATAWGTATFFGAGLVLAVATATCAIILSIALPKTNLQGAGGPSRSLMTYAPRSSCV